VNAPLIHGNGTTRRRAITASAILDAIADALTLIKHEDRLRWSDMGEIIGKSEDQVAKYADGSATMDVISAAKARAAWGSRFTGNIDRLIDKERAPISEGQAQHCILKCALAIEESRDQHGRLTIEDIRSNRATLENARDAIDAQLKRLKPQSVA
jgi:hypothetical protein